MNVVINALPLQIFNKVSYVHQLEKKLMKSNNKVADQAPVVQKLDNAIHRINHRYPTDKCQGNQLRCPVDLSGG